MPSEPPPVQVEFAPEFKRNLRALARKYRHIRSDVRPVIEQIQALLATIYSKLDQSDITPEQIRRIVLEFDDREMGRRVP